MKLQKKYRALLIIFALCCLQPAFANNTRLLIHTKSEFINSNKEVDLVLYFPGYGCWSKFLLLEHKHGGLELTPPITKYRPNIVFATFDTDPLSHFGSPKVISNIVKDIKKLFSMYKIKRIFIVGGSMGSSLALNFSSLADETIKNKIAGVLVYLPITDYGFTIKTTKNESFKKGLIDYFINKNKDPELVKVSSPMNYIKQLPDKATIILLVASFDSITPPEQANYYYREAKTNGKNISIYYVKSDHDTRNIAKEFEAKLKELLR